MKPLAVIDVETTGLNPYRHDRVVEVAAVLLIPGQGIVAELATLVNPERDVGPTRIHGITASDVINAPRFVDIAGHLGGLLRGAVLLAGHNVRFDISFLQSEFRRAGIEMPPYATLDTMTLAGGGTLATCCADHGVEFDGTAHAALHDARAAACLLQRMLACDPSLLTSCDELAPLAWPTLPPVHADLLPREATQDANATLPTYVQRLAERLSVGSVDPGHPEGERDYRALLWRALEDGQVSETESNALVEVATNWGLDFKRIEAIHLGYLSELAKAASVDRHITDAEREEIQRTAQWLGFGRLPGNRLQDLLRSCEIGVPLVADARKDEEWSGLTVCFSGESTCCIQGQPISRDIAQRLATGKGLRVMPSVTKKLDLLVVADLNTQSTKAKKARLYGTRILHEREFWSALGIPID